MTAASAPVRGRESIWTRIPDLSSPPMIIAALAVITAIVGFSLVVTAASSQPVVAEGTEARAGALSAWIERSERLEHDHADDGSDELGAAAPEAASNEVANGFAMPSAMMNGTPDEGFVRLQIEASFLNRGTGVAIVEPGDFSLEGSDGTTWTALTGGTLNRSDVAAQHLLNTVIAFDVAEEALEPTMYLVWSHAGEETRFAITSEEGHH